MVVEKKGEFAPSKLATELAAAGISCDGVTCTEDENGVVVAVQIICADGSDARLIGTVCKAHDPTPTPPAPQPPSAADTVLGALETLDAETATIADVVQIVKSALTAADAKPIDPATLA